MPGEEFHVNLTVDQLAAATGAPRARAVTMMHGLNEALQEFGINTPERIGMFLANVGHESGRLRYLSELWGPTPQQRRYERDFTQPWAASNAANRLAFRLGNVAKGDGRRFAGHGFLQITGRYNHGVARDRLRARLPTLGVPDFEEAPSQLATSLWGWMAAAEYAERTGCLVQADAGKFDAFCDLVNLGRVTTAEGDSNGYADRLALWEGFQKAEGL